MREPGSPGRRRKLACAVALLALGLASFAYFYDADQEAKALVSFFKGAAHSLKIDGAGAHFVTRHFGPKFAMGDPRLPQGEGWQYAFTLSRAGERFYSPDHHRLREFVVKRLTADSIVLGYHVSSNWGLGFPTSRSGKFTLRPFDNGTTFATEDAQTAQAR